MSNWNVLSVEAAMQQLNAFEGDDPEKTIRRPNTVSEFIFAASMIHFVHSIEITTLITSRNLFGNNLR